MREWGGHITVLFIIFVACAFALFDVDVTQIEACAKTCGTPSVAQVTGYHCICKEK